MEQRKVEPAMIIKKKTLSECIPRWIHIVCMFGFIPVTIKKDEIVFKYFSLKMLLMIILMNLGHLIMGIPYYIFDPENYISFFFKMANHAANLNATDLFSNVIFFFTKGRFQKKKKKLMEFSIKGLAPPPHNGQIFFFFFGY